MKDDYFTIEDAVEIAGIAFRTRKPGPLVGKEQQLLGVLVAAKHEHDLLLALNSETAELLSGLPQVKAVSHQIHRLQGKWNELAAVEKEWFANIYDQEAGLPQQENGLDRDRRNTAHRMARVLDQLFRTATIFDSLIGPQGRPNELAPLAKFIECLGEFWRAEAIGETFNPEIKKGQPINSASKLVVEASKRLGHGYSIINCENAWRPRRSKAKPTRKTTSSKRRTRRQHA